MTSLKISKFDFSATISNINAQFAPVNKGLNSASIRLQEQFRMYFRYARMKSLKFSKFNFTAAVDNIRAQFVPVKRGLNSAYIMLQQLSQKYFRYARMTSLKFSKFNFYAAISNIYAQFAPVSRGVYSAYFTFQQLFGSTSCMREWRFKKKYFKFLRYYRQYLCARCASEYRNKLSIFHV